MTLTLERDPVTVPETEPDQLSPRPDAATTAAIPVRVPLVAIAAALSSLGAAAMVASLFKGGLTPWLIAALGVAIGAGGSLFGYRTSRPTLMQYLVIPAAVVAGIGVVVAGSRAGGDVPGLVRDALQRGGLRAAPIPFDPGWRFLSVVLLAVVASTAVSVAVMLARPRLAAFVPVLLTVGAALLQREGSQLAASVAAAFLTIGAVAVAYGAELAAEGAVSGRFELRRLARGAGLLVALVALVVVVAQAGFLFPDAERTQVIPPQRPPSPPPEPDRVLFRVEGAHRGPWRVGTLDTYDGEAFRLPPVEPGRLIDVSQGDGLPSGAGARESDLLEVTFEIADVKGRTLPVPAGATAVVGTSKQLEYDPRTETVQLPDGQPPAGFRYTVAARPLPGGRQLAEAPSPDPSIVEEFGAVPPPPNEVVLLLSQAPESTFDRLQFVRQRLYDTVVAAGAGKPTEVTPRRVASMLRPGAEATPYEITAAEVLLARWAGVPARIGYGFFGGEAVEDGRDFRPKHGAAWLEAYFEGEGWVAIVGTPPKARDSLDDEEKRHDPSVVPTDELALKLYVPIRLQPLSLLFEAVRYWTTRIVPLGILVALAWATFPAPLKLVRAWRRRRWAAANGALGRVWVAYSELRDGAYDLNIGDVRHSPLEFRDAIQPDDEHAELAWLVTRGVWGDLRRDLRDDDADAAEDMSRSVLRRLGAEQTLLNRMLARVSRASLKDPFSDEVPNLWPPPRAEGHPRWRRLRRLLRVLPHRARQITWKEWRRRPAFGAVLLIAFALMLSSCVQQDGFSGAKVAIRYPDPLVPAQLGAYELVPEPTIEQGYRTVGDEALVSEGRVWTLRSGDAIDGSVQIALFKPDVDGQHRSVQRGVENGVGAGRFRTHRYGTIRLRHLEVAEQQVWLWFPPERNVMELIVLRAKVADPERVVHALVEHQLELPPQRVPEART